MTVEKSERRKIIGEFRKIYTEEATSTDEPIDYDANTVIVLSGHGMYDSEGQVITWVSPENIVRIGYAIDVIKKIVAHRLNKEEVTNKDLEQSNIRLFLNGESSEQENTSRAQLDDMRRIALAYNFPERNLKFEDCLKDGKANTLTQFNSINTDPRLAKKDNVIFITSDYHTPRVRRTAVKNLREGLEFSVLPAPQHEYDKYDVFPKVMGEIRRIIKYSQKGDIATNPTR